jgi:hypothetical protein
VLSPVSSIRIESHPEKTQVKLKNAKQKLPEISKYVHTEENVEISREIRKSKL